MKSYLLHTASVGAMAVCMAAAATGAQAQTGAPVAPTGAPAPQSSAPVAQAPVTPGTGVAAAVGATAPDEAANTVVVTGSTSRRTLLDTSVAITNVNPQELAQRAPRNTAEVLQAVPGIFVEPTAGPVSNNYSVRGLPGGGSQFVRLIEDGLPLIYGGVNDDEVFQYDLSIDHVEAIQGGTSGILTENGAGATINFISRQLNFDHEGGLFKVTGATYGEGRGDFWYSAPIKALGDGVAFGLSGYIDHTPGVRSSPFTYETYHLKAELEKKFDDGGFVRLSYKRYDEHDPYYADQPYSYRNGQIGGVPGLGTQFGNIIGAGFGSITVPDSAAANEPLRNFSLNKGLEIAGNQIRIDADKPIGDSLHAFAHFRYTQTKVDFNGVFAGSGTGNGGLTSAVNYLTDGPVSPIQDFLNQGLAAFPGTTQFGIRSLTTGQILAANNPAALNALNGNGLLQQTILNHQVVKLRDYGSDFGLKYRLRGDNYDNSLTIGGMVFSQSSNNDQSATSTVINDVANGSNIYDIVGLNAAGQVTGELSNNGLIAYGDWGQGLNNSDLDSQSIYVNDELTLFNHLHLDFGMRYEHEHTETRTGGSQALPIPAGIGGIVQINPNTFDGTYTTASGSENPVNYTFGANYVFSPKLSVYLRYAKSYQTNGLNPDAIGITLYEGGVTFSDYGFFGTVRGFRTEFADQSFGGGIDPNNANNNTGFFGDSNTNGVDVDVLYRPQFGIDWLHQFSVHGQVTYQDPKFSNVSTGIILSNGQNVSQEVNSFYDGKRPGRTPSLLYSITPAYDFPNGRGSIYARYQYTGSIFADNGDALSLPSYGVLSLGLTYDLTRNLNLNVSVQNATDELGVTEGNPRQGFTQSVVDGYFYGRGIIGTNAQFALTYKF